MTSIKQIFQRLSGKTIRKLREENEWLRGQLATMKKKENQLQILNVNLKCESDKKVTAMQSKHAKQMADAEMLYLQHIRSLTAEIEQWKAEVEKAVDAQAKVKLKYENLKMENKELKTAIDRYKSLRQSLTDSFPE